MSEQENGEACVTGSAYAYLSDADLSRMIARAYRRAARAWQEARSNTDSSLRRILTDEAESEQAYWRRLVQEREARQD